MNTTRLRRASAALLALFAADLLSAADQAPAPLLGALRIESLSSLATNAAGLADRLAPGSGAQAAMLPAMAAQFGLDADQELLVLLLDPASAPIPVAFVLPALDPEALKQNPAFTFAPATQAGVFLVTLPNGKPLFGSFVEKRLVLSPAEAGLAAALPVVRSGEDPRGLRASGGHIALSLAPARLYAAYKPMIDLLVAGMGANLARQAAAATPGQPEAAQSGQAAAAMLTSSIATLGDLDELALRLDLATDHLDTRTRLQARPGSQLATLLSPGRAPAAPSLASHHPDAVMHGYLALAPDSAWWTAYLDFTKSTLSGFGLDSPDAAAALDKTTRDIAAIWDGTATFDMFRPSAGFSGASVVGIKDADRALGLIRSLPEFQKTFSSLNAQQGLASDITLGETTTHAGARLVESVQTHRATTPAGEQALEGLKKLGMERMVATYAVASDRLLYTMGATATADAKQMLDARPAASSEIAPATYALPADANLFFALSLPRYVAWLGQTGLVPLPAATRLADAQGRPGLALAATVDAGSADIRTRLLTTDIAALVSAFAAPAETAPTP